MSRIFSLLLYFAALSSGCQAANAGDMSSQARGDLTELPPAVQAQDLIVADYPLPLLAHWNTGEYPETFTPTRQLRLLDQGHRLLLWFYLPEPGKEFSLQYYEASIRRAAELHLPISFISTQWERPLTDEQRYFDMPDDENPNVITRDGKILRKVSPFGPVKHWAEIGRRWTTQKILQQIQAWYPDPPLVLFISNNEHSKLTWREAKESARFVDRYGTDATDATTRRVFGEGWIERYRALITGMRDGLSSQHWRENSRFIGYNAFGGRAFGRWPDWIKYSLYQPGQLEPWPQAWDGASLPYYLDDWSDITDFQVMSPQIEAMNWVFMLEEVRRIKPDFWFELSVWDGQQPGKPSDKRKYFERLGQQYTPGRYAGMTKFGMWLLRPRVVRGFRNHLQKFDEFQPYFLALATPIDEIHTNPVLREFWRYGRLVPNRMHTHPYRFNVPEEYQNKDRWFLLDTDIDPRRPWTQHSEIYAFSLALERGVVPAREWLVYAFSPLGERRNVLVTVPGYGDIQIDFSSEGRYYLIKEQERTVREI